MSELSRRDALRKLAVGGCGLTEEAILPLSSYHRLEELDLDHHWTEGPGDRLLAALPQLPSLRVLHAIRNDMTADGFRVLVHEARKGYPVESGSKRGLGE